MRKEINVRPCVLLLKIEKENSEFFKIEFKKFFQSEKNLLKPLRVIKIDKNYSFLN